MRAFLLSLVAAIGLALGAYFILEGFFARSADNAHTLPSVRVGTEGSVDHRNFSGEEARRAAANPRAAAGSE